MGKGKGGVLRAPEDNGYILLAHMCFVNVLVLVFGDDPNGVDQARDITEEGQKDVQPEVLGKSHLQEHPQGWEEDRNYDTPEIQPITSLRWYPYPIYTPEAGTGFLK